MQLKIQAKNKPCERCGQLNSPFTMFKVGTKITCFSCWKVGQRSPAQIERQADDHRVKGRYAQVNPCYVCGKSAGIEYRSHPDTDGLINDELLVLCKRCSATLEKYDGKTAIKIAFPNREVSQC